MSRVVSRDVSRDVSRGVSRGVSRDKSRGAMSTVYLCLDNKTLSQGVLTSKGTIVASNGKEYSSVSKWRVDVMAGLAKKNRIYTERQYVHRSAR